MRTSITDLMSLNQALEEENFSHELRCLAYVFEGDLRTIPNQMKLNPVSFWQESVRNRAFSLKNLSATQIYGKILFKSHSLAYFEACLF